MNQMWVSMQCLEVATFRAASVEVFMSELEEDLVLLLGVEVFPAAVVIPSEAFH